MYFIVHAAFVRIKLMMMMMMMMMMIYDSEKGDVWLLNCAVASPGVATTSNQAEYTMERRRGSLQRLRK